MKGNWKAMIINQPNCLSEVCVVVLYSSRIIECQEAPIGMPVRVFPYE